MTTAHTLATKGMICRQEPAFGGGPKMEEEPLRPLIKVMNVIMEQQENITREEVVIVKSVKLVVDELNKKEEQIIK